MSKSDVVIVGAGESDRQPSAGRTALAMASEACMLALADAGLAPDDIDGLCAGYSLLERHLDFSADLAEAIAIRPHWSRTISRSGATGASTVVEAALAVMGGACDTALAVWADNRVSGPKGDIAGTLASQLSEFETAIGPLIASQYALIAQSYLNRNAATPEDLASVAVQFRKHASLNQNARFRSLITVEDVLASPMASTPLHAFECALVTDYGGAVVVTRADRAPAGTDPVHLLGYGESLGHQSVQRNAGLFLEGNTPGAASSKRAFDMAGMKPSDVQMAQIYDCFTITVLMLLEDFGFCPRGEAGPAVRDGLLDRNGSLPANTNGGMLSCASGGILHVTEAVSQLRGRAGDHQLDVVPENALVHGNGGILGAQTTMLLGRK